MIFFYQLWIIKFNLVVIERAIYLIYSNNFEGIRLEEFYFRIAVRERENLQPFVDCGLP